MIVTTTPSVEGDQIAEYKVIGVLIDRPILTKGSIKVWQIVLCAVLSTVAFVTLSFVKNEGKWQWPGEVNRVKGASGS